MTTGAIIGRFAPPHNGHCYLIDFAQRYVDDLTVVLCSMQSESIPGDVRVRWIESLYPAARVVHVTAEISGAARDVPGAIDIWADTIRRSAPRRIDFLFASENYGWRLADSIGADYIPVDPARSNVPVSGSMIRDEPYRHWKHLPSIVRAYYCKRIAVVGNEAVYAFSRQLADRFATCVAPCYFDAWRSHIGDRPAVGNPPDTDAPLKWEEVERVAKGQAVYEDMAAERSYRALVCPDTIISLALYCQRRFSAIPPAMADRLARAKDERRYALALTLGDGDRRRAEERNSLLARYGIPRREIPGDAPLAYAAERIERLFGRDGAR